jgi:hypothetical protein
MSAHAGILHDGVVDTLASLVATMHSAKMYIRSAAIEILPR